MSLCGTDSRETCRNVYCLLSLVSRKSLLNLRFITSSPHEGFLHCPSFPSVSLRLFKMCFLLLVFACFPLTRSSLRQIASYVNKSAMDTAVLQRSLAILESMVLNSQDLYHKVAQEITIGQLIPHLQG